MDQSCLVEGGGHREQLVWCGGEEILIRLKTKDRTLGGTDDGINEASGA